MQKLSHAQAVDLTRRIDALTPERRERLNAAGFAKFNTPEGRAALQAVYDKISNPEVRKAFRSAGRMAELVSDKGQG